MHWVLLSLLLLSSCGKKQKLTLTRAPVAAFQKYVNPKDIEAQPNLNADRTIVNNDYPIEIALYRDKRFYYNLPNLGDGKGSWEYEKGYLLLKARRDLFDMVIEIHPTDEGAERLALRFIDRFGLNLISTETMNLP